MLRSLALVALTALPAQAEGERAHVGQGRDRVERYVASNVTETLYHELAHAIIDLTAIPVLGPEEFAADTFAAVMLDRLHNEAEMEAIIYDVGYNYLAFADDVGDHVDDLALWDLHGPDLQRYYNFLCLSYGANPDERDDIVEELGLPEERMDTCVEEYELAAASWGGVLEQFAPKGGRGTTIHLDWVMDRESKLVRLVEQEISRLNTVVALPRRLNVSVIPCGEANAFYDPDYTEIQICTELGAELTEIASAR